MFSRLMATFYDKIMSEAEEKCLRAWRTSLLQDLSGQVLELGCGTGANLAFYSSEVKNLLLAEPDRYMRQKLIQKLPNYPHLKASFLDYNGKTIPMPDESIDAVISTLVLCSVDNPQHMLAEIYRVLKPNGKLFFIEHVAAGNNTARFKWQRFFEPFWKVIACGCHLTRSTEQNIIEAGFVIQEITRQSMRGVPAIVRPCIRGKAIK